MTQQDDKPEFDRYASDYKAMHDASIMCSGEESEYFAAYKADVAANRLGLNPSDALDILDFGTGIGGSIGPLRARFPSARITGADVSAASIAMAQQRHGAIATFEVIEEHRLPFADASFDLVFVACVFHHIPLEQRPTWMAELHRVLRPGGHLVVFEHNMLNPMTMKVVRDCPFDEDAVLLPRRELLDLCVAQPFAGVQARYIVFFPKPLSLFRPLEPALCWLPLGAQYYVHATA